MGFSISAIFPISAIYATLICDIYDICDICDSERNSAIFAIFAIACISGHKCVWCGVVKSISAEAAR